VFSVLYYTEGVLLDIGKSIEHGRKEGSWLIKMDSNDRVISISRPRHRKRLPIARKFSAIWGAWMVSKNN